MIFKIDLDGKKVFDSPCRLGLICHFGVITYYAGVIIGRKYISIYKQSQNLNPSDKTVIFKIDLDGKKVFDRPRRLGLICHFGLITNYAGVQIGREYIARPVTVA